MFVFFYIIPDDSSRQSMVETNVFDSLLDSVVCIENKTQTNCQLPRFQKGLDMLITILYCCYISVNRQV